MAEADLVTSAGVAGVHLMAQPLGYRTPDVGRYGWITLPEFPYGNRIDITKVYIIVTSL